MSRAEFWASRRSFCAAGRRKAQPKVSKRSCDRAIRTQHHSDAEQGESPAVRAAVSVSPEQAQSKPGGCLCPAELTAISTTAFQSHTSCWCLTFGACHISPRALGEGDSPAGAGCTEQMEHSPSQLFSLTGCCLDHEI